MTSRLSCSSTSSYDNEIMDMTSIEQKSSTLQKPSGDGEDEVMDSKTATVDFQAVNPDTDNVPPPASSEFEVIDIDERQNEKLHGRPDDEVVLRRNRRAEDASERRSSFKKHARLSRMLQNIDSSSDDDEELYTFPAIPARSIGMSQVRVSSGHPSAYLENVKGRMPMSSAPVAVVQTAGNETTEESIPMKELSKIVNPSVLSEVKAHLKRVARKSLEIHSTVPEPSPAKLWEMKKRQQSEKALLNKVQAAKIKAGWKVRKCLNSLPEGETVNTFYLSLVKLSMSREVEALFSHVKVSRNHPTFDMNYRDADDKSAMTIAIDNRDEGMMTKLIEHEVDLGVSIFHVIAADFMEGLKLLMLWDPCVDMKIETENNYFQIGMTPLTLAAYNNNYRMLTLLHEYGHRLTELKDWSEGIQVAWESANERRMVCYARAQPAYITLTCEAYHMNPMKYCLKEIKKVKQRELHEHELSKFYKDIRILLEDYMCSLLDFVCSSNELADLFQFDSPPLEAKRTQQLMTYIDRAKTQRWKLESRFELLEKASRKNLVRFVTHQQSQLALSYLRFRSLPFLRNHFFAYATGLLFPILSIFYICAPDSALGGIITLPVVSFNCHMMSDFAFAAILLLKIAIRDSASNHLGEPLTVLEWLICLWILGKWVQEAQECINRGIKAYFRDHWNYSDLLLLLLFTVSILIRVFDAIYNRNSVHSPRYMWKPFEPRLVGEGLQAWGYVFVFIRLLGLTRVDRNLGPLQISLAKMLGDIVRFLCLFALVLLAFAFGLSDLYWYYGTAEGAKLLCQGNSTSSESSCTKRTAFSSMPDSLIQLFWALFGLFELDSMSLGGKHSYTETVGKTLLATYHMVAIIVMLNMLIAMMSNSYNATSEDEETAWKFHRTSVWIRFIRREVVRPPPMNLFPNPWRIAENFRRFKKFCRELCPSRGPLTEAVYNERGKRINKSMTLTSRQDVYPEMSSHNSIAKSENARQRVKETETTTCCFKTSKQKDKTELIERESSFDAVEKPEIIVSARSSAFGSRRSSFRRQRPGFIPAVLKGVQEKLRSNLHAKESKDILQKLVRRYKLKNLVTKKK